MKSIKVPVLGKSYSLKVNESDEQMMYDIASYVNNRFSEYRKELHGQPESTITALAVLSIAEDYYLEKRAQKKTEDNSEIVESISNLLTVIKQANTDI